MKPAKLGPERYEVTIMPDGDWYVERRDRTGYDTISMYIIAGGSADDQDSAEIAARGAIEQDRERRAFEAEEERKTRRFTVDA